MDFTAITYCGRQESKCGYCKGEQSSIAHGMQAYQMLPQDYQDLIDRGWRRSGHYCYKPHNQTTCCPCYAIRCDTTDFKISKSHKKVLKRMSRFLRIGKKEKTEEQNKDQAAAAVGNGDGGADHDDEDDACGGMRDEPRSPNVIVPNVDLAAVAAASSSKRAAAASAAASAASSSKKVTSNGAVAAASTSKRAAATGAVTAASSSKRATVANPAATSVAAASSTKKTSAADKVDDAAATDTVAATAAANAEAVTDAASDAAAPTAAAPEAVANAATAAPATASIAVRRPHTAAGDSAASTSSGSNRSRDGHLLPCKKAKQMRRERLQVKLAAKGTLALALTAGNIDQRKTLTQLIGYPSVNDKHKLTIVLVPSNRAPSEEEFLLYRKYQLTIHNDDPQRVTPTSLHRFCYKSPLKVDLVNTCSKQFRDTQDLAFALYQKYQAHVHKDIVNKKEEYMEFLGRSPLKFTKPAGGPPQGYGSFHQQYWLDDKLIAVGVIDILPYCVSAVYFFYDPDYSFLSLGTYGSLREIELVQHFAHNTPALKYYYMGYYIHSCPKMRYKGKLVPSYLLCPETYVWSLLTDEVRAALDACKYQRFNKDQSARDENEFVESNLDLVLILKDYITYTYRQYIQSFNIETLDNMLDIIRSRIYKEITGEAADREEILEYGKLVGRTCAHRMLYVKHE